MGRRRRHGHARLAHRAGLGRIQNGTRVYFLRPRQVRRSDRTRNRYLRHEAAGNAAMARIPDVPRPAVAPYLMVSRTPEQPVVGAGVRQGSKATHRRRRFGMGHAHCAVGSQPAGRSRANARDTASWPRVAPHHRPMPAGRDRRHTDDAELDSVIARSQPRTRHRLFLPSALRRTVGAWRADARGRRRHGDGRGRLGSLAQFVRAANHPDRLPVTGRLPRQTDGAAPVAILRGRNGPAND